MTRQISRHKTAARFACATFTAWLLMACTEDAAREKTTSAPGSATAASDARQAHASQTGAGGPTSDVPLNESARDYLDRTGADTPPQAGELAAQAVGAVAVCALCHGPQGQGNPALATPRIGGLAPWYLARQLKYFRAAVRGGSADDSQGLQMRAVVFELSDPEIEDLASYLATLDPPPAQALTRGDAAHGKTLYTVCAACHGQDGSGSADLNTPSLVGQNGEYLRRQLERYRDGRRGTHELDTFGQQMRPVITSTLAEDQDVIDVVSYLGTLSANDAARSGSGDGVSEAGDSANR